MLPKASQSQAKFAKVYHDKIIQFARAFGRALHPTWST